MRRFQADRQESKDNEDEKKPSQNLDNEEKSQGTT